MGATSTLGSPPVGTSASLHRLNFVGHALVALWQSTDPAFVLGAMLPDFASMVGARLAAEAADESPLGRGIALHHATDEVFHSAHAFVTLMHDAMQALVDRGVPRGPARAVGHIGVEMIIDGELLAHDAQLAAAYETALASGRELSADVFRSPEGYVGFRALQRRLAAHGAPFDYRNVEAVGRRLSYMLGHRPRLAIAPENEPHVRTVLYEVQERLPTYLPSLLEQLRAGLISAP